MKCIRYHPFHQYTSRLSRRRESDPCDREVYNQCYFQYQLALKKFNQLTIF